jgi:signal peptidase
MSDAGDGTEDPSGVVGWLRWFWTTEETPAVYVRDVVTSVGAVLLVGLLLFAASGIWPPMVAVESSSMEPNMERGDLVFVMSEDRFVPDAAPTHDDESTGVVPADRAAELDYAEFNRPGDVIVYNRDGSSRYTPVIHRAMLWVEDGENWYGRANPDAVGNADSCRALQYCPAPHAGFITKGDNDATNAHYDQVTGLSAPVKPAWVIGTAEFRVPYLGQIRLLLQQSPAGSTARLRPPGPAVQQSANPAVAGTSAGSASPRDRVPRAMTNGAGSPGGVA